MSNKAKSVRKYVSRSFDYIFWAGFFGLLTYWYWFAAGGDMVTVYILNITGISIALLIDKITIRRIYKKAEASSDKKALSKLMKKNMSSLRTSLYLFYIFVLIFSQLLEMGASIEVSENIKDYLDSVKYGVIVLFALDSFFGYLISDDERKRKFEDKYKDDPKK